MKIIIKRGKPKKSKQKTNITYDNQKQIITQKQLYIKPSKGRYIAIILRKTKSALIVQIPNSIKSFSVENNTYFTVQSGVYNQPKKGGIIVYLEGCCLPLEHSHIQYEKHYVLLTDKYGKTVTEITDDVNVDDIKILPKDKKGNYIKNELGFIVKKILDRIKGLEFDTTIANTIFHSGLIEKIGSAGKMDKITFFLLIFMIINVILTGLAIVFIQVKI